MAAPIGFTCAVCVVVQFQTLPKTKENKLNHTPLPPRTQRKGAHMLLIKLLTCNGIFTAVAKLMWLTSYCSHLPVPVLYGQLSDSTVQCLQLSNFY